MAHDALGAYSETTTAPPLQVALASASLVPVVIVTSILFRALLAGVGALLGASV